MKAARQLSWHQLGIFEEISAANEGGDGGGGWREMRHLRIAAALAYQLVASAARNRK
jgi:hypothetical protein